MDLEYCQDLKERIIQSKSLLELKDASFEVYTFLFEKYLKDKANFYSLSNALSSLEKILQESYDAKLHVRYESLKKTACEFKIGIEKDKENLIKLEEAYLNFVWEIKSKT